MKAQTLKALKSSIAHWTRLSTGKHRIGEAPYWEDCALCRLFMGQDCWGCPVSAKTTYKGCYGTPYQKAEEQWTTCGPKSPEFKKAARAELKFLKSLLPKTKTKKIAR